VWKVGSVIRLLRNWSRRVAYAIGTLAKGLVEACGGLTRCNQRRDSEKTNGVREETGPVAQQLAEDVWLMRDGKSNGCALIQQKTTGAADATRDPNGPAPAPRTTHHVGNSRLCAKPTCSWAATYCLRQANDIRCGEPMINQIYWMADSESMRAGGAQTDIAESRRSRALPVALAQRSPRPSDDNQERRTDAEWKSIGGAL